MQNTQQPQMNLDVSKTTPVLTKDGNKIWTSGFLLRKASKFITGTPDDMLVPIQVFYDASTGEICKEGLPDQIVKLIEDGEE